MNVIHYIGLDAIIRTSPSAFRAHHAHLVRFCWEITDQTEMTRMGAHLLAIYSSSSPLVSFPSGNYFPHVTRRASAAEASGEISASRSAIRCLILTA
jgi:hypothetical protein